MEFISMDFDSRFGCCDVCNSISFQCQNNRSSRQIQGQGDCKCNTIGNKKVWMTVEKANKLRNKCIRDRSQPESNEERKNNFLDGHCYCYTKQDFPDKLKRDSKQEKKEFGNYDTSKYFWDSPSPTWTSKSETFFMPEQPKRNDYSNPDKLLAENILEFEEKVDFLFRIFKDYGQKFPPEGYIEQAQTKPGEGMLKDFAHLFNFNKRLCAAEEGIEKLALILENLVKETSKRKTEESYNEPVDFDEMSVTQRINYLKSRNDMMLSFMKALLKSDSPDEYYTKLTLLPNDLKPSSAKDHCEKYQSGGLNRVKIMETLQGLRMRMTELKQKKPQEYKEQPKTWNEKPDTPLKYPRNKLEVISEQAELGLSDESDNALDDFGGKDTIRILNEKLAEESDESDFVPHDVTFRILAHDSEFMKPSLDKLFTRLDSPGSNIINGTNIQISLKEESSQGDITNNYDGKSDVSYFFCEESSETSRDRNKLSVYSKQKEPAKRDKVSPEKSTKDSCAQNSESGRKILRQDSYVVFPGKGSRGGCSVPELGSPSREGRKREVRRKDQRQRPMTDPSSHRKSPLPVSKSPLPDKYATRNPGINNVKSKNKIFLSKKSCVQTS